VEEGLKRLLDAGGIAYGTLERIFENGDATVFGLARPGAEAIETWFALRDALGGHGWWPVVLGPKAQIVRIGEDLEFNLEATSPRAVVERGLALDTDEWFAEHMSDAEPDECEWADEIEPGPNDDFTVTRDVLSHEFYDRVTIALVPAANAWEVPAYLGIGGWNDCPDPYEQVAILRRWHERYGAEIVGYTGDVVELHVTRPVEDAGEARRLASEQYAYCSDIVDQGIGTVDALAAALVGSIVWYFWWD
jgi:hypothetical protein